MARQHRPAPPRWRVRMPVGVAVAAIVFLLPSATSAAAITSVFAGKTVSGAAIPCAVQSDGVRVCPNGYVRLDDDRYEVRDPQYAAGLLADEGSIDPARIGAVGASYGGGVTFQLGTLKDRIMRPDGTLSPWRSPNGTPLSLAAA